MQKFLLVLGSVLFFVSPAYAGTEVFDLLTTQCATSSDNVKLTSETLGYETYLYKVPDTATPNTNWGMTSGSCTFQNTYNCNVQIAPTAGESINTLYNTGVGPVLADGFYFVAEISGSTPCTNNTNGEGCKTLTTQWESFEIASDGECYVAPTPFVSSTLEEALATADFFVDVVGFLILAGMLLFRP